MKTKLLLATGLSLYCDVEGKTIYELVIDELEGEVTGHTRDALNDHLIRCRTCRDVYSRLKRIIRVVRAFPEDLATVRPADALLVRKDKKIAVV
ncbi:MAG TPA: hypothetical protein VF131_07530 [Blastocatellia bacterium]|nr:hypothetical protein [Blastocatellia bacterium]